MDRWDVLALLGVLLLGAGLALLAPWLGVSVAGMVLLVFAVVGALGAERPEQAPDQKGGG